MTEGEAAPPPPNRPAPPAPPGYQPPTSLVPRDYPLHAGIERQAEYSRFMPLIKWLILLPHYIALVFLGIGALVVVVISFFAVLFTRRYPRGMFDYVLGVHRWAWRVQAYLYLMVDRYPPFTLDEDPGYPAPFTIDYPEEVDRWRPLVQWLLIIPYAIVGYVLGYLAAIVAFLAFFAILFTKRFPAGMFEVALISLRWVAKANAYEYWLTTVYPRFAWE